MKPLDRSLLLAGCLLTAPCALAQSIAINDSAVWHEEHWLYDGLTAHHSIFTCRAAGDTVISGNLYTKIRQLGVDSVSTLGSSQPPTAQPLDRYLGAIRTEESTRTWHVRLNGYPEDLLLYDFDLQIGSSVLGTFGDCGTGLTVTDIDAVMVSGSTRQRFHLNMPGRFIIEGVGGSAGLFGQLCQLFEEFSCLHVYDEPDGSLVVDGCGSLSTGIEQRDAAALDRSAFPNPTLGPLRVTGAEPGAQVVVRDAMGRMLLRTRLGAEASLDISSLPAGLYVLRFGTTSVQVVKE